jgi:hypothetical protein
MGLGCGTLRHDSDQARLSDQAIGALHPQQFFSKCTTSCLKKPFLALDSQPKGFSSTVTTFGSHDENLSPFSYRSLHLVLSLIFLC